MLLDFEETASAASSSSNPVLEESDGDKDAGLSSDIDLQVDATPPPTKRKKYACIFRKEHEKIFPWAAQSSKGPSYAFCTKCSRDINLGQGGTKDLKRHEQTRLHGRCHRASSNSVSLQYLLVQCR